MIMNTELQQLLLLYLFWRNRYIAYKYQHCVVVSSYVIEISVFQDVSFDVFLGVFRRLNTYGYSPRDP